MRMAAYIVALKRLIAVQKIRGFSYSFCWGSQGLPADGLRSQVRSSDRSNLSSNHMGLAANKKRGLGLKCNIRCRTYAP